MEEEFDIEKWRATRPMDYILAIDLVNRAVDKNEVFMSIYDITRMYLPNVLYKYCSLDEDSVLNESKLITLRSNNIFMSDAKYLNDPFDGKAYYYTPERLMRFNRLKHCQGRLIDDFTSFAKVSSFTANGVNSMPMWAHYANNHRGYCVSYDMNDQRNLKLRSTTFPVQYTEKRVDITNLMESQVENILLEVEKQQAEGKREILINDLSLIFVESFFCNIKHSTWGYENEFRCTVGRTIPGIPYFPAHPKEIYIGMKCSTEHTRKLIEVGKELNVSVYQMGFDDVDISYNLHVHELN